MSLSRDEFIRYSRHLMLEQVGEAGQRRLSASTVAIVGLGGLGSPVALYLAAAGVGKLILCDADHVDKSNLQRQILYRDGDCGAYKVDIAAATLQNLNPHVQIQTHAQRVDESSDLPVLDNVDLILDCTDNTATRQLLNRISLGLHCPFISASAIGWEGQLVQFAFHQHTTPCFACLISPQSQEPILDCSNAGVIGPLLGIIGSMQALQALKCLIDPTQLPHGRLSRFDGRQNRWLELHIPTNPHCPVCSDTHR